MMMRFFNVCALTVVVISAVAGPKPLKKKVADNRPNIIIILTDDMGYSDIGAFGGNFVPTPNLDRLAKMGRKFGSYYSAAPICSPSRAGLLTGQYPGRWNFSTYLDNKKHNADAQQADFLDPQAPSIARVFKDGGYATGHFGKWHMGGGRDIKEAPNFDRYGYDEHNSTYESPDPDPLLTATNWIWSDKDSIKRWDRTKYFVEKTLDFMKRHKGQPCFVNLWPDDVHTPWVPRKETEYTGQYPVNPNEEAAFKLVLKEYDKQVGHLLDGLKEIGADKNTIVIFTSDNGPLPSFKGSRAAGLRGSKLSLYEGGTRMPFLIAWPGHIPAGTVDENSEVSALDLLPSLARIAGIKRPAGYKGDGMDRSPTLLGKPSARTNDIYWEYGRNTIAFAYPRPVDKSPNLALRSGQWKLLMNSDGSNVELYDIIKDKNESANIAADHPKLVDEMKTKLTKWWAELPKLIK
ncbi:sulfatase family protein [Mucilaginibacter myungsuensis]|uniref:Sulfatase-like hydrolase/transferase n=1 Tax=Mucilaginibacter myungsuensis TaxID=649104 RepID=A0A929KZC4_9SPHI|nr:sulfatase-like hydrolase/transferase [Mucilaginibacter myungsuensis]MBE9660436.1 sulfatase-like hydrolase/transferase [Mucilaginibacter myungsuensis]MDN3600478.1 sulfatase-like hydrolase/transferase [Mucilaginibacter myungsuensis]